MHLRDDAQLNVQNNKCKMACRKHIRGWLFSTFAASAAWAFSFSSSDLSFPLGFRLHYDDDLSNAPNGDYDSMFKSI